MGPQKQVVLWGPEETTWQGTSFETPLASFETHLCVVTWPGQLTEYVPFEFAGQETLKWP